MRQSVITIPEGGLCKISDGYHTFEELYHHRAVLFSVVCNQNKGLAWKARFHEDGTMFKDMFIVGIETPFGQATYHCDAVPYWEMFQVKALDFAPKWDGHTPDEAVDRLRRFGLYENNTAGSPGPLPDLQQLIKPIQQFFDENVRLIVNNAQPECSFEYGVAYASRFDWTINIVDILNLIKRTQRA